MLFKGQMEKQRVVYPCNWLVLSSRKELTIDLYNSFDGFQGYYAQQKKKKSQKQSQKVT